MSTRMSLERSQPDSPESARGARGSLWWRRLILRRSSLLAMLFLVVVVSVALFAPLIAPHDPNEQHLEHKLQPPFWKEGGDARYLLGTDQLGRDILSRIIWGSRVSLSIGIFSVAVAGTIGVLAGLVAGYFGGRLDTAIMRIADVQLAFPGILLAIAIIAVVGPSLRNLIVVLGVTGWVTQARVVRAQTMSLRELDFVQAARALGASDLSIMLRHILPNVFASVLVIATVQVGGFIVSEAGLSFLGLGVPLSTPTWGGMLNDAQLYLLSANWLAVFPGLAIMLTVLSINLVGDLLRDLLDPKTKFNL